MVRPIKREFLVAGPSREQGLRPFTQPVVETMQTLPPELTPNRRRKRPSPTQASRSLPVSPVHRSTRDAWHNLSREETMNDLRMFVKRLRGSRKRGNQRANEQREAVVVFPPNYDDVTAVMGRADLLADYHSNHEDGADRVGASRPWTHYLLEEELVLDEERDVVDRVAAARGLSGKNDDPSTGGSEKDGARQDAGEASSEAVQEPDVAAKRPHPIIVEDEDKLQRGLAKIRALDVKLMLATREAVDVSRVLSERVEAARARLEDVVSSVPWDAIPRKALFEEHRRITSSSEPPSPMTSSRTTMSDILNGRTTFLTDGGTRVHTRTHARTRQETACGLRSGHTGVVEEGEEDKDDDGASSRAATSQRTSEPHTGRSNVSKTSSRRSNTLSTTKTHGRVAVDYVRLNAEQVGDGLRGHLTREEEDRYRQLVHGVTAYQPVGGVVDGEDGGEMVEKGGTESTTLDENVATHVDATASLISSPHCSPHKNDCNAASRKGKHFGRNDDGDDGDDDDMVLSSLEPYGFTREARAALDAIEERLRMLWASAPSGVEMRGGGDDGGGGGGGGGGGCGTACAATGRGGGEAIRASSGWQDGDDGGSRGDRTCGDVHIGSGGFSACSSTSAEPVDHGDDGRHAREVANRVGVLATRAAAPISTPHSPITVTTSKTHPTPLPSDATAAYEAATGRTSARSSALTSATAASSRPLDGGALRGLSEYMVDDRERKQAQMRMRQIDAMLEAHRHNDPLSVGANSTCTSVQWTSSCSRRDEDGDDDASEIMSDASRALTEHVISSGEVEEEVRRAVGALGRKPREDEREAVEGLLQRLTTSRSALDATVRDDDDRADRVRKSLQRTAEILKGFPTTACMHDGDLGSEGYGGDSGGLHEEHGVHGSMQGFSSTAVAAAAQEVVQL